MPAQPQRRQVRRPPVGRALLVLLVTGVLTGGACWGAALSAPSGMRPLIGWSGGVAAGLLTIAAALAVYGLQAARHYRRKLTAMDTDARALADETLPALVTRMRDGASADTALADAAQPDAEVHQRLLDLLTREIGQGERMRAASMAACANAAGRVQALSTSMLADLRDMEARHDEEVLGDLLKVDHSTAQAGRLADSIAILTGARSGRRWTKPIVMESILRGAVGRISAYQRVQLHCASTVAVVGYAAEGVMHALAELMDNATSFSPPSERVHVYVEEVQAGVVVTIDDAGLVMGDLALSRAEKAVSAEPLDLASLSGTRLGLAVVGCLARKHNLTVSFRPSARGGTGVVLMIPRKLITEPRQQPAAGPREEPAAAARASGPGALATPPTGFTAATGEVQAGSLDAPALPTRQGQTRQGQTQQPQTRQAQTRQPQTRQPQTPQAQVQASAREEAPQAAQPPTAPSPTAQPPAEQSPAEQSSAEEAPPAEPSELPRRRRGETLAKTAPRLAETTKPSRPLPDAGTRFGAFRRASRPDAASSLGASSRGESSQGESSRGEDGSAESGRTTEGNQGPVE